MDICQKGGHPWEPNPVPMLWQSTIHPTSHLDHLCHCSSNNLWVLLHDFCCSLLAAHHKSLPIGTGHWALPSASNSRYYFQWCSDKRGKKKKMIQRSKAHSCADKCWHRRWEHFPCLPLTCSASSPLTDNLGFLICSLQDYLPLRFTPVDKTTHSTTSITQNISLSQIPRTYASGAHMPIWSPLPGLQPKNQL